MQEKEANATTNVALRNTISRSISLGLFSDFHLRKNLKKGNSDTVLRGSEFWDLGQILLLPVIDKSN